MDVSLYLERMGYDGPREPTWETLRQLHVRHLEAVPFENLDIERKCPIVLDEAAVFDKVVRRRRGGFCYELNSLFAALLRTLGFRVTLLSGRVSSDGTWPAAPEFDHLLLEVTRGEEGPWLVDVGFGDGFCEPPPLLPGQWTSHGKPLRLEQRGEDHGLSAQEPDGSWKVLYAFTRVPRRLEDFSEMCQYHQTSPDSFFLRKRICSRKTATGRVTLSGDRLILTEQGQRTERTLGSESAIEQALFEHFGIPRPGTPTLP
jgi:N-hydroxyarylamine O-acetyltransferase